MTPAISVGFTIYDSPGTRQITFRMSCYFPSRITHAAAAQRWVPCMDIGQLLSLAGYPPLSARLPAPLTHFGHIYVLVLDSVTSLPTDIIRPLNELKSYKSHGPDGPCSKPCSVFRVHETTAEYCIWHVRFV